MDRNTFLAIVLSFGVFMLWVTYQADRQPPQDPSAVAEVEQPQPGDDAREAAAQGPVSEPISEARSAVAEKQPAGQPVPAPAPPADPSIEPWQRTFERNDYQVVVTNRGAALVSWTLSDPNYDQWLENGEARPMQLLRLQEGAGALTTPFVELGLGDLSNALYRVEHADDDSVSFVFEKDGVVVRKRYAFARTGFDFTLDVEVTNGTERILTPRFQIVWPAVATDEPDFKEQSLKALHSGEVESVMVQGIGQPGFLGFGGSVDPVDYVGEIDWAGVDVKYFIGALAPDRPRSAEVRFEPLVAGTVGATILGFDTQELPPGQVLDHSLRGYIGPKEEARLLAFGSSLEMSVDLGYAWLSPLTAFFHWFLTVLYTFIPNYGWAIIVMTILVRVVTAPIMMRQMRSMERMRAVQPHLKEIQEKYADDRQKQSEEMMALYRREGVNPLGGCLPMLLQFPVFIGLFFALQSSIELRHAPFIFWINDLSAPESIFTLPGLDLPVRVLPIIMGASMVIQARVQPMSVDPAQARMMQTIMPIMMTVLFYQFPSGLVLYWMVSNFLGIGHQLWVGKHMKGEGGAAVAAKAVADKATKKSDGAGKQNGKRGKKGKKRSVENLQADG